MRVNGPYNHFFTRDKELSENAPQRHDFIKLKTMSTSLNLSSSVLSMQNSPPKALALQGTAPFASCLDSCLSNITTFCPINSHNKDVHVYCCIRDLRI